MFSEPLKLSLNHNYYIRNIKEIVAMDSILTMDEKVRGCQENPQDLCTNMKFTNALRNQCQCLPIQLRFLVDNVCIKKNWSQELIFHICITLINFPNN